MAIIPWPGDGNLADQPLISAPQTLTDEWTSLGDYEIPTQRAQRIAVYFDLDINNSKKVRMRLVGKTQYGVSDYFILHAAEGSLAVNSEYYEFADADNRQDARFRLDKTAPIVQVQVMANTVGVTPARILSAKIIISQ